MRAMLEVLSPGSIGNYRGLQDKLPGIDPKHGIVPGYGNPYQGSAIRFSPGATPEIILPKG